MTDPTNFRPLISLDRHDIEDLPPDAFEVTFPPFITVIPRLFTTLDSAEEVLLPIHPAVVVFEHFFDLNFLFSTIFLTVNPEYRFIALT